MANRYWTAFPERKITGAKSNWTPSNSTKPLPTSAPTKSANWPSIAGQKTGGLNYAKKEGI